MANNQLTEICRQLVQYACVHRSRKGNSFRVELLFVLPINLNMCVWCSKEPSSIGSFKYLQHMFWLRNKMNNS